MWQRFTERARKVVFSAQEEAQKFGEGYVSTEHLLLGIVREEDSVAARVIERLGVSLPSVKNGVAVHMPGNESVETKAMTLTPRAKRVIDLAYDEARNLGNNYIGTEHLLLGLIREQDGIAGRVFQSLGIDLERARDIVVTLQEAHHLKERGLAGPSTATRVREALRAVYMLQSQAFRTCIVMLACLQDSVLLMALLEGEGIEPMGVAQRFEQVLIRYATDGAQSLPPLCDVLKRAQELGAESSLNSDPGFVFLAGLQLIEELVTSLQIPPNKVDLLIVKLRDSSNT